MNSDEHLFFCPKCDHHKRKLSVNISKNVFKCWVCEYSGINLYRLVRKYGNFAQRKKWGEFNGAVELDKFEDAVKSLFESKTGSSEEIEKTIKLPEEFISLTGSKLPLSSIPARKYLKDRNITQSDILYWKIGYCPSGQYRNRIIIPSFNLEGKVNFFVARSYDNEDYKYMNPKVRRNSVIFNHLFLDFQKDIVITEGIFDAIVAGPNAAPILGSNLKEGSKLFQNIIANDTPVYIALDSDMDKNAIKLIDSFLKYDIELYKVDISPFKDVGEMTKAEFLERKKEAAFFNSENYLSYKIINSF